MCSLALCRDNRACTLCAPYERLGGVRAAAVKARVCSGVLGLLILLADMPLGAQPVAPDATVKLPAGMPLPPRAWVERPMPSGGIRSYMQTGGKHGRALYHPGLKAMVIAGRDWHMTEPHDEDGNG